MNDRTLLAVFTAGNGQKEAVGSNHFVVVDNFGVFGVCKASLEYTFSLKRQPGRIREVILGHCTFLGLQERGCLSTFFTIYPFIRKNYFTNQCT